MLTGRLEACPTDGGRAMRLFMLFALIGTFTAAGCGKKEEPQANVDPKKGVIFGDPKPPPPEPPPPPPDPFQGKGNAPPKGLVQGVRAAAYRPERQNELKQIGTFFIDYVLTHGRNPATDEDYLKYMERDYPKAAQAIREKYYVLNLNAKLSSNSVIAYEVLQDQGGYQSVRGDGSVSPIPEAELRMMLMP
jgi:hypothetical protein